MKGISRLPYCHHSSALGYKHWGKREAFTECGGSQDCAQVPLPPLQLSHINLILHFQYDAAFILSPQFSPRLSLGCSGCTYNSQPLGGDTVSGMDAAALATRQRERHCFLEITLPMTSEAQLRERLGWSL